MIFAEKYKFFYKKSAEIGLDFDIFTKLNTSQNSVKA